MRELTVGSHREQVIERSDFPEERLHSILNGECIALLGYGVLGRALGLLLREGGWNVLVGCRDHGRSWHQAVEDGWQAGVDLVPLAEASRRGTMIFFLLSDAGQVQYWPTLRESLTAGKALVFGHGFALVYHDQTGVEPSSDIDVMLLSPRGSGTTHHQLVKQGAWLNASYAIHQDATGRARDRCQALGIACRFGHLLETSFEREVHGDLTGERGSLLGAIYGLWLAQYEVLRESGLSPIESFIETVEEATQSLYPLIADKGMDWMYANASATAQRGALDWYVRFRDVLKPVFRELYADVASGNEAKRVLEANGQEGYRQQLEKELQRIRDSEMWQAGLVVRGLRAR